MWLEMELRRKQPHIQLSADALMNPRTRRKVEAGTETIDPVYDKLDRLLKWVPGDAKRAALTGIPPRPLEGTPQAVPIRRLRKLEVAAMLSRAAALAADSPDDVPEEVLDEAERQARELLARLSGKGSSRTSTKQGNR